MDSLTIFMHESSIACNSPWVPRLLSIIHCLNFRLQSNSFSQLSLSSDLYLWCEPELECPKGCVNSSTWIKTGVWFFLKPFFGLELTSDSASYFLTGIYFEDNLGELFENNKSRYYFTPSFGAGFYDDGSGKKLGNTIEFRTSLEISYELKNNNRIGISLSHISNANLGNKNPGAEILSISYHIPY